MKPILKTTAIAAALLIAVGGSAWQVWGSSASAASAQASTPAAALSVTLTTPTRAAWPQTLQASGTLSAWQEAVIGAETGSLRITELLADVGSRVRRGQLLARLADDALQAQLQKQQAAVAQSRASLAQAQMNLQRAGAVDGSGALSGQQIDDYRITEATSRAALASSEADLLATRIQLSQTRILAVDDGIVSSRNAVLGNVVPAGTELFRLVRQGKVEWRAELAARQLAQVQPGQVAHLTLASGQQIEGRVRLIAPTFSTSTGRALVYVSLPADSEVQPGLFANGSIDGPATPALTLPQTALVPRDGRNDVFLLKDDGTVTRRTVSVGRRLGDRVEVLAGLKDDARVVASGGAFLSEGTPVQVAQATPAAPAGRPDLKLTLNDTPNLQGVRP
jgi:RND family efflux transporter MFP subunit